MVSAMSRKHIKRSSSFIPEVLSGFGEIIQNAMYPVTNLKIRISSELNVRRRYFVHINDTPHTRMQNAARI